MLHHKRQNPGDKSSFDKTKKVSEAKQTCESSSSPDKSKEGSPNSESLMQSVIDEETNTSHRRTQPSGQMKGSQKYDNPVSKLPKNENTHIKILNTLNKPMPPENPMKKTGSEVYPVAPTSEASGRPYKRPSPGSPPNTESSPLPRNTVDVEADEVILRPPMTDTEMDIFKDPDGEIAESTQDYRPGSIIEKAFIVLLCSGFGILAFFLLLQVIIAVDAILSWPSWIAIPIFILISLVIGYFLLRLIKLILGLRNLPIVAREKRGEPSQWPSEDKIALRMELINHLRFIFKEKLLTDPNQLEEISNLIETADEVPDNDWFNDYKDKVQKPIIETTQKEVWNIALAAGVSAAISPWRLVDTIIALNATLEVASCTLRRFGIRPDKKVVIALAFDSFKSIFFASVSEDMLAEVTREVLERLPETTVGPLIQKIAPRLGQGIGITYFVNRMGRRMIDRLTPISS
jgi:uncharacterized membrane protein YcjF (UPF0283 family)